MTERSGTTPAPRAVPDRSKGRRRRHAAAATRLVVGGVALAGTFDLAAVMAAESTASTEAAPVLPPPTTAPPTTTPPTTAPAPAPRTVVIVRRHVITGSGAVISQGSSAPRVVSSAPAPAPSPAPAPVPATPAPAPAPAPVTTTKGS